MSTRQLFTVTTTATDQELIRHFCSTEDAHSLRILTDRHYAPVQLYVSRRLADREAVRDITQDVFERLILLIQRPDFVVRDLHQLLYTIAAGKLIDHYRRVGREGSISLSQSMISTSRPRYKIPYPPPKISFSAGSSAASHRSSAAVPACSTSTTTPIRISPVSSAAKKPASAPISKPSGANCVRKPKVNCGREVGGGF